MASRRILRVNELLREELAELLRRETEDPELQTLISITEVDTSPDSTWIRLDVEDASTDALGTVSWRAVDEEYQKSTILEEAVKALVLAEIRGGR